MSMNQEKENRFVLAPHGTKETRNTDTIVGTNSSAAAVEKSFIQNAKRRLLLLSASSLLVPGFALLYATDARSEALGLSTVINLSGRIRALSQRIAKAYTQLALDVLPEKGNEIILSSQAIMQHNLADLQAVATAPEASRQLSALSAEAKTLIALISTKPIAAEALKVSNQADRVLAEAEKMTQYFQSLSKTSQAKIVNIAGRQRMLSQRIAKYYLLIQAGYDNQTSRNEMTKARSEFKSALETMNNAAISTPSIRGELDLAKSQWGAFEVSLDLAKPSAQLMRNVVTTSERLLEVMDNLTNQYDLALKDILGEVAATNRTHLASSSSER